MPRRLVLLGFVLTVVCVGCPATVRGQSELADTAASTTIQSTNGDVGGARDVGTCVQLANTSATSRVRPALTRSRRRPGVSSRS